MKKIITISVLFLLTSQLLFSQRKKVENLPEFDVKRIHFGFVLAGNSASFSVFRAKPFNESIISDTIRNIVVDNQSGFNLGIISSLNLNRYFSIRFIPSIIFTQRNLEFTVLQNKKEEVYIKPIESTLLDFPILLKYKSARVNNFAAYVIGGAKYSYDLASQQNTDNISTNPKDIIVKLYKHDIAGEIGFGTDYYLPYFKFGIELKMSYGLRNVMVKDKTMFSSPIDDLRSKMFTLSFTFEG